MTETINLSAPTTWKALNAKQLKYAAWLLSQTDFTQQEIWTYAFIRFTGIKLTTLNVKEGYRFKFKRKRFTLTYEECLSFSRQFSFLTSAIDEITPLKKMKGVTHIDSRFRGVPLAQYLACDNYYQAFLFKRDEQFLNYLCAAFYTGKKGFDDSKTAKRSRKFARLPFHVRYTVFLWFSGLKKVLQHHFPHYFIAMDVAEDEKPESPNMRKHIEQMLRALSGGDVTKVKDLYAVDTWSALAELNAKALEYKTMKSKMNK